MIKFIKLRIDKKIPKLVITKKEKIPPKPEAAPPKPEAAPPEIPREPL